MGIRDRLKKRIGAAGTSGGTDVDGQPDDEQKRSLDRAAEAAEVDAPVPSTMEPTADPQGPAKMASGAGKDADRPVDTTATAREAMDLATGAPGTRITPGGGEPPVDPEQIDGGGGRDANRTDQSTQQSAEPTATDAAVGGPDTQVTRPATATATQLAQPTGADPDDAPPVASPTEEQRGSGSELSTEQRVERAVEAEAEEAQLQGQDAVLTPSKVQQADVDLERGEDYVVADGEVEFTDQGRERAVETIAEQQLEEQFGGNVQPGEDFVVADDGSGVELTQRFRQNLVTQRTEQALEDRYGEDFEPGEDFEVGSNPTGQIPGAPEAEQPNTQLNITLTDQGRDKIAAATNEELRSEGEFETEEPGDLPGESGPTMGIAGGLATEEGQEQTRENIQRAATDPAEEIRADVAATVQRDLNETEFVTVPETYGVADYQTPDEIMGVPIAGAEPEEIGTAQARGASEFAKDVSAPLGDNALGNFVEGAAGTAALPGSLLVAGEEGAETAVGVVEGDVSVSQVGQQGAVLTDRSTSQTVENPARSAGAFVGGLAVSGATSRLLRAGVDAGRLARFRATGRDVFDADELADPPTRTEGMNLPEFTRRAQEDPDVARQEFVEQARDNPIGGDDPAAFHVRGAEASAEFGRFGRRFESPEGSSELPGTFQSADLSNLRLADQEGSGGLSNVRFGLPRLRRGRVLVERDVDVGVTRGRTRQEVGEFLQEDASREQSFIRTDADGGPTPEQEAIAPPGSRFVSDELIGIRVGGRRIPGTDRKVGGRVLPGRITRRGEGRADIDADSDAETFTSRQMARETAESLRRAQNRPTDVTPTTSLSVGDSTSRLSRRVASTTDSDSVTSSTGSSLPGSSSGSFASGFESSGFDSSVSSVGVFGDSFGVTSGSSAALTSLSEPTTPPSVPSVPGGPSTPSTPSVPGEPSSPGTPTTPGIGIPGPNPTPDEDDEGDQRRRESESFGIAPEPGEEPLNPG